MEFKAREVLSDCKDALEELNNVQGSIWRRRFITAMTLLRAVGHVLIKVDGKTGDIHKSVIENQWAIWKNDRKNHEIYFSFIEKERNLILKEYQINGGQSVTILMDEDRCEYSYPMNDGYYKGRDQREMILEAIQWWERELSIIENEIEKREQSELK